VRAFKGGFSHSLQQKVPVDLGRRVHGFGCIPVIAARVPFALNGGFETRVQAMAQYGLTP